MQQKFIQKIAAATLATVLLFTGTPAVADDNEDACGAVMCLAGQAMGQGGGSECQKYIQKYFAITVFKDGVFRPDKTLKKRSQFLDQCQSADNGSKSSVNNNYGSSRSG